MLELGALVQVSDMKTIALQYMTRLIVFNAIVIITSMQCIIFYIITLVCINSNFILDFYGTFTHNLVLMSFVIFSLYPRSYQTSGRHCHSRSCGDLQQQCLGHSVR